MYIKHITFGSLRVALERFQPRRMSNKFANDIDSDWYMCSATGSSNSSDDGNVTAPENSKRPVPTGPDTIQNRDLAQDIFQRQEPRSLSPKQTEAKITAMNARLDQNSRRTMGFPRALIQERTKFYDSRHDYAAQRKLLTEALQSVVSVITTSIEPHLRHASDWEAIHPIWKDAVELISIVERFEHDLDVSDGRLNSLEARIEYSDDKNVEIHGVGDGDDHDINREHGSLEGTSSVASDPPTVQDYYQNAGAIKYLSDALISLGPRPQPDLTRQSSSNHDHELDPFADNLTPEEYAERHLKLVKELRQARSEESRLRRLCLERHHVVEEVAELNDESYQEMLDALTTGPALVDSVLIENSHDADLSSATQPKYGDVSSESRIANWVAGIEQATRTTHGTDVRSGGF